MYDLIILGAGPAGLAASIYASRYKINHVVIGSVFDSSVFKAHLIENWPGEKSIKGSDLLIKFHEHAKNFGTEFISESAIEINERIEDSIRGKSVFSVKISSNKNFGAKTLLISLGTSHKKLNIPGEDSFLGKGVSYCAVCDGMFLKDKIAAVVGGSSSAAMAATMLSEHASKVFLIYRGKILRCEPIIIDRLEKNPKIEIIYNTNVLRVNGEAKVEGIELDNEYKGDKNLKIDGLFIEVGAVPSTSLIEKLGVKIDSNRCIIINSSGATNIKGVYAAGDITNGSNGLRQIVTAVSEGAIAATGIYRYLKGD